MQTHFYATKNDLVPVLEAFETGREIKYVKFGRSEISNPESFFTFAKLPKLGIASNESAVVCTRWLIFPRNEVVQSRQASGRYLIDQLHNPNTVELSPGGLWRGDILLYGRVATVSQTAFALETMKALRSAIRKRFKKIRAYYVGAEAEQMLDIGKRLTLAEQTPRLYDLKREEEGTS